MEKTDANIRGQITAELKSSQHQSDIDYHPVFPFDYRGHPEGKEGSCFPIFIQSTRNGLNLEESLCI